ncbi:hypothetical protein L3Q82_016367 [Scortum barcoo]|uniref:Uncharacterized protein n=1 Tax=Scortum barcoo TaxID=214431 RepID=A0ACB8X7J4_9TELE|nr:hypothetical protein L3Q82_016367 [Scortum barcoo]
MAFSRVKSLSVAMDAIRTRLRQTSSVGVAEEVGGAPRVEMRFVTSEAEAEVEAESSSDITALVLQRRLGYQRAAMFLCVCVVIVFTTAFLLAYAVFGGRCQCSQVAGQGEEHGHQGGGAKSPTGGGAGLYLGELRVMMRRLLQDEDIYNTISRVSRASHPPGSSEGTSLASEILRRFRQLQMDHTWTESLYATLQFPDRSQRSSLWLVDSAGLISEQILLNPSDYCPYSATGSTTVRQADGMCLSPCFLFVVQSQVHLGSGDPFTPGFPSFNHSQFPPIQSSGLPLIPALPISATVAAKLLSQLSGPSCPPSWRGRLPYVRCVVGPEFSSGRRVKMSVHNVMTPVLLNNIFSSLEGRVEPDQYIILGAQRDSLGPGAVKSGVGTAILLELARTFSAMVKSGKTHLHTVPDALGLLFVSWDAGDFGNVGATEWLEGYLSMLHLKAVAYFSLDQGIMGDDVLSAYSSPLLVDLLDAAIRQVEHPKHAGQTIYSQSEREGRQLEDHEAFVPEQRSVQFHCVRRSSSCGAQIHRDLSVSVQERAYPFVNTPLDTASRLQEVLGGRLGVTGRSLGELVGEMVLRLAHDHILPLRITSYAQTVLQFSARLNKHSAELQVLCLTSPVPPVLPVCPDRVLLQSDAVILLKLVELLVTELAAPTESSHKDLTEPQYSLKSRGLSPQCSSPIAGFQRQRRCYCLQQIFRAAEYTAVTACFYCIMRYCSHRLQRPARYCYCFYLHHDDNDTDCNTILFHVEYYFLSQYVSVVETPFRHVIHGRGEHTLSALTEHLALLTSDPERFDEKRFRTTARLLHLGRCREPPTP